jgi:hypothetical protein
LNPEAREYVILSKITTFKQLKHVSLIVFLLAGLHFSGLSQDRFSGSAGYLRYYPNPASSFINFDYQKPTDKTHTLQVFNFMGKKVYELKNTPDRNFIPLEDFYRGIYIYQLRDRNGKILESGKFQVVK